ncbi:MAG: helix-turn-helix domain-containing protein [Oscillospiraceae bacterium]|jgi:transcriptional regulator with XRE-family HTH domain|nr:helix-turn-helix domain-containing protein [Oscillospiraceae bacterium]
MNGIILGKRIKEARLSKKMTQSDVVGGYITRNMLSQIESGAAFPSIRTLEYLSGVLGVPMSELIAEEGANTDKSTATCPSCGHEFKVGK